MKYSELPVHALGLYFILVVFINTGSPLMMALTVISVISISLILHYDRREIALPGLTLVSIVVPFSVGPYGMGNVYPLLMSIFIVIIPLMIYWIKVIGYSLHFDLASAIIGASHFAVVLFIFYGVVIYGGFQDIFLADVNKGPQAVLLSGFGVLLFLIYNIRQPKT